MADPKQNKTDDFFNLIKEEQKIENPFATDEILFRDQDGNLKVLHGGQVLPAEENKETPPPVIPPAENLVELPVESIPQLLPEVKPVAEPLPEVKPVAAEIQIPSPVDLDAEADEIISQSGVNISDNELSRKLKNIIRSRLKGIRNQTQVREVFLDPPSGGGMGFDEKQADQILAAINQKVQHLNVKLRDEISPQPFSDLQTEAYKILESDDSVEEPEISLPPTDFEPQILSQPESEPQPIPEPISTLPPVEASKPIKESLPPVETKPEKQPSISRPIVSAVGGRPKIEDVKYEPRLTGPIEEIGSMTLTDFRRLAATSDQAIAKILEKIGLLEDESFVKKTEGIKAWKENEIYRLYLQLGDLSMEERKPISDIIKERQAAGQPTLTQEELEAVIELNQKLRY